MAAEASVSAERWLMSLPVGADQEVQCCFSWSYRGIWAQNTRRTVAATFAGCARLDKVCKSAFGAYLDHRWRGADLAQIIDLRSAKKGADEQS